ncbi:MAG: hypothetical protein K0B08_09880 [Bacteroidales bacterium]|nr:hypothetical protein [Bacteroidales bacterium]
MRLFSVISLGSLFTLLFASHAFPQADDIMIYDSIAERILLKKEYTLGATIHVLGMGANFRRGSNKTFFTTRFFEIEVVSQKHPKQIRVINPYYLNAKSYVYGKLNHVYILRGGYGYKKLLNRKPYWGGIELRAVYMGGLSVAFAKPVYLYFFDETYSYLKEEKYDPDNYYHSAEYIFGRAPYLQGIGELKVYPGIFTKAGLNFEFGKLNTKINALEAGGVFEFFPVAIPIMAYNPAKRFVLTFYLNYSFGKRYN